MMMGSREAVVNYMTPLGLAHLMGTGHHYGPAPWVSDLKRPEWNPDLLQPRRRERHRLRPDRDRQQTPSRNMRRRLRDGSRTCGLCGDKYLLWFHHVPWDMRLDTGRTVWDELLVRYDRGVDEVAEMQREWQRLRPFIDPQRFAEVANALAVQDHEAKWWRDASIAYFQSVSKRPLPPGIAAARAFARLLQVAAVPERAGLAALTAEKKRPPPLSRRRPGEKRVPLPLPELGSADRLSAFRLCCRRRRWRRRRRAGRRRHDDRTVRARLRRPVRAAAAAVAAEAEAAGPIAPRRTSRAR